MSNFFIRTLSGIVYAALVIGAIFAGSPYFFILSLFFIIFTTREFHSLGFDKSENISWGMVVATNLIVFLIPMGNVFFSFRFIQLLLIIPFIIMMYVFMVHKKRAVEKVGKLLLGIIYLAIPMVALNSLFYPAGNYHETPQIYPLIGLFVILWVNDSMAYISGSIVGRTKLFERVSPGKTWEGSLGGLLFSMVGAWLLSIVFTDLSLSQWLGFALITVIFGTFGDLFESVLKRSAGVKESGNIIPGHGGILDRLDSLLFASPMVYLYLIIILNL